MNACSGRGRRKSSERGHPGGSCAAFEGVLRQFLIPMGRGVLVRFLWPDPLTVPISNSNFCLERSSILIYRKKLSFKFVSQVAYCMRSRMEWNIVGMCGARRDYESHLPAVKYCHNTVHRLVCGFSVAYIPSPCCLWCPDRCNSFSCRGRSLVSHCIVHWRVRFFRQEVPMPRMGRGRASFISCVGAWLSLFHCRKRRSVCTVRLSGPCYLLLAEASWGFV